jgi:undecaprenyl-diphosphatase
MDFLYWLQSVRTPFFDRVFSLITTFGEETLFIAIAMAFFWCIDRKRGYYLLLVGFTGVIGTQILKMSFRIPRPWVLDPEFPIVESAREAATGYSFPSGHTQCATTLYGGIAGTAKKNAMRIGGIALVLLVAFSRLYLGVHTLLDVGVGLLLGTVLLLILYPLYEYAYGHPKRMYAVIGGVVAITLANLIFVHVFPFPQDVDAENLENAISTAWKMTGIILGVA